VGKYVGGVAKIYMRLENKGMNGVVTEGKV